MMMIGAINKSVKPTGDGPETRSNHTFNPRAAVFTLRSKRPIQASQGGDGSSSSNPVKSECELPQEEVAYIGPTYLPVNTRVWNSISSYSLEAIARKRPPSPPMPQLPAGRTIGATAGHFPKGCLKSRPHQHHASCPANPLSFGPVLLASGIIQLRLRESITVEMTLAGSVKVINQKKGIAISVSSNATASAMTHPNGVVFQFGPRVDIAAFDAKKSNNFIRYAKMWHKGISLTYEGCAVIFLVDSAGTRTTSDLIRMDLSSDYVNKVFYNDFVLGAQNMAELNRVLQHSSFVLGQDGSLVFQINEFRITQGNDGQVKLTSPANQAFSIRTSPSNGSATVTTPNLHSTASLGATSHLFVRSEERRMHFDGAVFIVRNSGHSAGFNEYNRLRVY